MLTEKMQRALEVYHLTGSKVDAYRRGYNTERMAPATLHKRAYELFARPEMQAELKTLQAEARARHTLEIDEWVQLCSEIARSSLADFVWVEDGKVYVKDTLSLSDAKRRVLKTIVQTKHGIRIEIHDRQRALDMLAHHLGLYEKVRDTKEPGELRIYWGTTPEAVKAGLPLSNEGG